MTVSDDLAEYAAAQPDPMTWPDPGLREAPPRKGISMKPYLKGLLAALGVAASGITAAAPDVSGTEWLEIAALTVAAALGVYYAPYAPAGPPTPTAKEDDPRYD